MSSIPTNVVTSVAQAQLTQQQRAEEANASEDARTRQAERQSQLRADHRESVEDMAAATGLKVDPDGRSGPKYRRRKPAPKPAPPFAPAKETDAARDAHARSAALLACPDDADKPTPPPLILDIEA